MKKIICMLCLIVIVLSGCQPKEVKKAELPALEPDHYLYEVKDDQGHHVYLLGTMHIGAKPVDLDGNLKRAYDEMDTIAFEIEMIPTQKQIQDMNVALLNYPLKDLKTETFQAVWEELKDEYESIEDFALTYNAVFAMSLANQEIWNDLQLNNEYGVDMMLYKQAKNDKKTIQEIEGYDLQIDVLEKMGEKSPMLILISMLDKEAQKQATIDMIEAYSQGRIDAQIFDEDSIDENDLPEKYRTGTLQQELEEYQDILLSSRNDDMLDKAVEYLKNDNTLLAVGAGHVLGEDGLVQQLKDKGYHVEKVQ